MSNLRWSVAAAATASLPIIVALGAAAAQGTGGGAVPDPPPWANPDGTIDDSQLPEQIPVLGDDGMPLLDANGDPVTLTRDEVAGPPPDGPGFPDPNAGERSVSLDEDGNVVEILTQR